MEAGKRRGGSGRGGENRLGPTNMGLLLPAQPTDRQLSPAEVLNSYVYADRHRKKGDPCYHKPITDKESDEARSFLQRQLDRHEPAQPG